MKNRNFRDHLILNGSTIKSALKKLDDLASDAILFVCDDNECLIGSLTDGDVRRGLLRGASIDDSVESIIQTNPKYYLKGQCDIDILQDYRNKNFRIIPILENEGKRIIGVINFRLQKSYLPLDVLLMAGGKGIRLRPLTLDKPKPMLPLMGKPIIERHIERLSTFGIQHFVLSINYLADQIKDYFGNGHSQGVELAYVQEEEEMGTIGSASLIQNWNHDFVLIANSDLLSNVDYENWFSTFIQSNQDLSVLTIPYSVNVPFAVLETHAERVIGLKEKPTFHYNANGGMYLIKREWLSVIPKGRFDATDLIETMIEKGANVGAFLHRGYWLDIGRHEDYLQAQMDMENLSL